MREIDLEEGRRQIGVMDRDAVTKKLEDKKRASAGVQSSAMSAFQDQNLRRSAWTSSQRAPIRYLPSGRSSISTTRSTASKKSPICSMPGPRRCGRPTSRNPRFRYGVPLAPVLGHLRFK